MRLWNRLLILSCLYFLPFLFLHIFEFETILSAGVKEHASLSQVESKEISQITNLQQGPKWSEYLKCQRNERKKYLCNIKTEGCVGHVTAACIFVSLCVHKRQLHYRVVSWTDGYFLYTYVAGDKHENLQGWNLIRTCTYKTFSSDKGGRIRGIWGNRYILCTWYNDIIFIISVSNVRVASRIVIELSKILNIAAVKLVLIVLKIVFEVLSMVRLVMDWRSVQGVPCFSPNDGWDRH